MMNASTPSSSPHYHHSTSSSSTSSSPAALWPAGFYSYLPLQQHYHDPALASLAYRPLHVPLQQPQHQRNRPLHQLTHAPTSVFQQPAVSFAFQPRHFPRATARRTRHVLAMADLQQQSTSEEELAELQKLSNDYEPEITVCFLARVLNGR